MEKLKKERVSNHLSDDIVFSILSKLPLKYLKQLACVCKSWSLLFENPDFMKIYRKNFLSNNRSCYNGNDNDDETTSLMLLQSANKSVLHLISGKNFEKIVNLDWPPPFRKDQSYISCFDYGGINGVICLYQGFKKIVLWNPTTGEYKVIRRSPVEKLPYDGTVVLFHGFGYDPVRDDYKVFRRVQIVVPIDGELDDMEEDEPMVSYESLWEIYSLRSNSWRILDVDTPYCHVDGLYVQVYLDGMCHWWSEGKMDNDEECLVSFDFSNEVFFTTPEPSDMDDGFDFRVVRRHLVVLKGYIALVSNYEKTTTFHVSILGQVGVEESWTKLFIIGPLASVEHPIGVGEKSIFFKTRDKELVWFDLDTQKIEELGVKDESFYSEIEVYKKSLLPIVGINK